MDDELSGFVFIKDGVPIIGVNSLHHPNRQRFPGKKFPLYLVPEGYKRIEDENGYSVILKEAEALSRTL